MASLNYNKVIICGHLTADPDCRQTQNGTPVASFRVAVNRRTSQDCKQTADFLPIIAWQERAQFVGHYLRKGMAVFVEGRLQTREYTDRDGGKRNTLEVIADDIRFVDSKNSVQAIGEPSVAAPKFEDISNDNDLPF